MRSRSNSPKAALRREIAAVAARMIAEDGINDFGFAKRKAARQLGLPEAEALPTNTEVEAEVRAWQALYQDEEQPERIRLMRLAAIEIMELLDAFRPYLTGGVLDGTAGRYSEVELELYPESAKDVEIFLLNQNLPYVHREPRRNTTPMPEAILALEWDEVPVRLTIHQSRSERTPRRRAERARRAAIEALLQQDENITE